MGQSRISDQLYRNQTLSHWSRLSNLNRTGAVVRDLAGVVFNPEAQVLSADAAVDTTAIEVLVELGLERRLGRPHKARLFVKQQQQTKRLLQEKIELQTEQGGKNDNHGE